MLIRIYKNNNLTLGILLPLIALAFWLPGFFSEKEFFFSGKAMPLFSLAQSLFSGNKILALSIAVLLIISEALLLNYIIQEFHLLKSQTFLPALVYIVLMSSIPEVLLLHPVLFSNLFLILAFKRGLDLSGSSNSSSSAFDSAFFISIGSLFYFPAFLFLIFVWLSLVAFRSFSFRDFLIAIIGICLPYLFAGVYYYWFDEAKLFLSEIFFHTTTGGAFKELIFLKSFYAFLIFLLIIIVMSIPPFLTEMGRNKAGIRSSLRLFIWFGMIAVVSFIIAPSYSLFHFCFAAIPLSIIFSNLFLNLKPAFSEIIFSLLILFIIIYRINY